MSHPEPLTNRQTVEKQSKLIKPETGAQIPSVRRRQAPDNTGTKQARLPVGTARAIKSRVFSEVPSPARHWGGKRNSASRVSDALTLKQAENVRDAAQFAAAIGLPLNRHVTIHWEQAGLRDNEVAMATGRFLKLAGDWIAKRARRSANNTAGKQRGQNFNIPDPHCLAWAWVRENGDGKGTHVHILLHLPAGKSLGSVQRRWVSRISNGIYRRGTVRTERIGGTTGAAHSSPAAYHANLAEVVGYILKGTAPAAARIMGLERQEPGGRIIGRRASTSQNIARAARLAGLTHSTPGRASKIEENRITERGGGANAALGNMESGAYLPRNR